MKIKISAIITMMALTIGFNALAVPAKPGVITVVQPDGSTLNVKKIGDEYMHFTTTEDGTLLIQGEDGFYNFAIVNSEGAVISTGERVTAATPKRIMNISEVNFESIAQKRNIAERKSQTYIPYAQTEQTMSPLGMQRAPQTGMGLTQTNYPRTGSPKGLIILVEYSDVKFNSSYNAKNYFNDMINGENFTQYNGTGSAFKYFSEQSGGVFTPSFDVYGPVTLPNPQKYYGGNDKYGDDSNPHMMAVHAIQILDENEDIDFSQYDTNRDGWIDNVFVFYAGQGEASYGGEDSVWPHSWNVAYANINLTVDGVRLGQYACSNEWERNRPDGVGTFVHEFSHVMGLPDLYTTDYGSAYAATPGDYSVLDSGPYNNNGCTPPNYSAFELNALGWVEPIIVKEAATISLDKITSGQYILIQTEKNTEFFLFENRQLEGWDKYIPYHGMLVWHIDYVASQFNANAVNNNLNHQYVDIVEAGGTANKGSLATTRQYPFPGTLNKTEFTSTTTPAFKSWAGRAIDLPITNIKEVNGIITFDVAGGSSLLATPETIVPEPGSQDRFFIASWSAVPGATDYLLTVVAYDGGPSGTLTNGFDKSTMPAGWTTSATATYDSTSGNSGSSSPSLKMSNGFTLSSPSVQSDITSVTFWHKGSSTMSTGSLAVEGLVNGTWTQLTKVTPADLAGQEFTLDSGIPAGTRQIRFVATVSRGSVLIDDIAIVYGGPEEILADYDGVSTNGKTTYRVDKLKENHKDYYFTVVATDGTNVSFASAPTYVSLVGMAGIEDVAVDNDENMPVEYFNLQGVPVVKPVPGSIVIERRGKDVRKVIVK